MVWYTFPREYTKRRLLAKSAKEAYHILSKYNYRTELITSVYSFRRLTKQNWLKPDYQSAIVDKVLLDFDHEPLTMARRVDSWAKSEGYGVIHVFSGKNIQTYVSVGEKGVRGSCTQLHNNAHNPARDHRPLLDHPADCVWAIQDHIRKKANVHADLCTIGNLAQMCRHPDTLNLRRGKVSAIIPPELLDCSIEQITDWTQRPHPIPEFNGFSNHGISPDSFDKLSHKYEQKTTVTISRVIKANSLPLKELPPCMTELIFQENPNHMERLLIVRYLAELFSYGDWNSSGYDTTELADKICQTIALLKWSDYDEHITAYQVRSIMKKANSLSPWRCSTLKQLQICHGQKLCQQQSLI